MRERCQMRAQRNAATQGQYLYIGNEAGEAANFPADLIGELTRRTEHEAL